MFIIVGIVLGESKILVIYQRLRDEFVIYSFEKNFVNGIMGYYITGIIGH